MSMKIMSKKNRAENALAIPCPTLKVGSRHNNHQKRRSQRPSSRIQCHALLRHTQLAITMDAKERQAKVLMPLTLISGTLLMSRLTSYGAINLARRRPHKLLQNIPPPSNSTSLLYPMLPLQRYRKHDVAQSVKISYLEQNLSNAD